MSKLKVILATLAIFISGLAAGALMMRAHMRSSPVESRADRPPPPKFTDDMRAGILDRMTEDLGLNEEQRTQIDGIIAGHQEQLSKIWEPVHEKSEAVFASMRDEISGVLDDDQRRRFLEFVERHKREHDEHRSPQGDDGPPPRPVDGADSDGPPPAAGARWNGNSRSIHAKLGVDGRPGASDCF